MTKQPFWPRKEVAKLTNLSERRVLFYTEQGVLYEVERAVGRGYARQYSMIDIIDLTLIRHLDALGINLQMIKEVVFNFHQVKDKWWTKGRFTEEPFLIIIYLAPDGGHTFGYRKGSDIATAKADRPVTLIINMTEIVKSIGF